MDTNQEGLLTREEVADLLALSPWAVRDLTDRGELPVIRFSPRRWRYRRSDVEAFIERFRVSS